MGMSSEPLHPIQQLNSVLRSPFPRSEEAKQEIVQTALKVLEAINRDPRASGVTAENITALYQKVHQLTIPEELKQTVKQLDQLATTVLKRLQTIQSLSRLAEPGDGYTWNVEDDVIVLQSGDQQESDAAKAERYAKVFAQAAAIAQQCTKDDVPLLQQAIQSLQGRLRRVPLNKQNALQQYLKQMQDSIPPQTPPGATRTSPGLQPTPLPLLQEVREAITILKQATVSVPKTSGALQTIIDTLRERPKYAHSLMTALPFTSFSSIWRYSTLQPLIKEYVRTVQLALLAEPGGRYTWQVQKDAEENPIVPQGFIVLVSHPPSSTGSPAAKATRYNEVFAQAAAIAQQCTKDDVPLLQQAIKSLQGRLKTSGLSDTALLQTLVQQMQTRVTQLRSWWPF